MIRMSLRVMSLGVGLVAALPLWADSPTAAPAADGVAMQGMRVVRDAKTGKLRAPTDAELRALLEAEKASPQGIERSRAIQRTTVERHANGMQSARLGTQSLVQINASVEADNTVRLQHANPAYDHPAATATAPQE